MEEEKKCDCGCEHKVDESDCKCHEGNKCECHKEDHKNKKEHRDHHLEKLKKAMKEIDDLNEENLRVKAELVNYRKRKDEEVTRMLKYANEDLVEELLPVIDNLERAIKLETEDASEEVKKYLAGVKMIYCNAIAALEKYGVKAIDGNNKPFDPTYHQAVMAETREGVKPGMVLDVLQKGYLLKDKVIRPAMVKVSQ